MGHCPSPGLWLFPLSFCQGQCGPGRQSTGAPTQACCDPGQFTVPVWASDFPYSFLCSLKNVCHFWSFCLSIPPIRYLSCCPSVHQPRSVRLSVFLVLHGSAASTLVCLTTSQVCGCTWSLRPRRGELLTRDSLPGFLQASVPHCPGSCLVCPQVHAPDLPALP